MYSIPCDVIAVMIEETFCLLQLLGKHPVHVKLLINYSRIIYTSYLIGLKRKQVAINESRQKFKNRLTYPCVKTTFPDCLTDKPKYVASKVIFITISSLQSFEINVIRKQNKHSNKRKSLAKFFAREKWEGKVENGFKTIANFAQLKPNQVTI